MTARTSEMALTLKSVISVRYFSRLVHNVLLITDRASDENEIRQRSRLHTISTPGFTSTNQRNFWTSLDVTIKKLDQDVRRAGRISRQVIDEVLNKIHVQKDVSSSQSLLLIQCCGNCLPEELPETRTALVLEIWQTLMKCNVQIDVSHYNALLQVHLENEHPFSPNEVLAELKSRSVKPNRDTFHRLISRYCQEGDVNRAAEIVELMRSKQLAIGEQVFNALILGYSQANDIESAVAILSDMKQSGVEPTTHTYTALLCAYAKHGKIDEILTTLDECEANEIFLLDKDLFEVIYILSTNNHSDAVQKIIPRLRKLAGYNPVAVNLIMRLVNKGEEDVAYIILKTLSREIRGDGVWSDTGSFLIKQMVKLQRPVARILSLCQRLQEEGLNGRAFSIAVEMATHFGSLDIALRLFAEIQKNGVPVKSHNFWPLICAQAKIGPNAVITLLRLMQSQFGIKPSRETIREYVVPNLKQWSYDTIISMLRGVGISRSTAMASCIYDALIQFKIREAAILASTCNIAQPGLLIRPLADAVAQTNDYQNYISIVRSISENLSRISRNTKYFDEEERTVSDNFVRSEADVVGQFVFVAICRLHNTHAEGAQRILSALVEQGLSFSKSYGDRIQNKLGPLSTPEISALLHKLNSGTLKPIPHEHRLSRVNLCDEFVNQSPATPKTKEPNFEMNDFQTIEVVLDLVAGDQIDESIAFLHSRERNGKHAEERGVPYNSTCYRILNLLAEKGRDVDLYKIFTSMERNNLMEISNVLVGPLVKVHLVNNDVSNALSAFEAIATKYNCTPWTHDLACRLINLEDERKLKLLTDVTTKVHGEAYSLSTLVFAYVDCGRIRSARKNLKIIGGRIPPQRMTMACKRFCSEGKPTSLEGLIEATKGFTHLDRHEIFYNLLLIYCNEESPQKALDLWTKLQNDVGPNDRFLTTLAHYLDEKGVNVPFVVPSRNLNREPTAETPKKSLELNVTDESNILELMLQNNRLNTATEHVMKMLESNVYPLSYVFRKYLHKVVEGGNCEVLEKMSRLLPLHVRKSISFDNRLCDVYRTAGKSEEYVDQIMRNFKAATEIELDDLVETFPYNSLSGIFEKHPELITKFEKFAVDMAKKCIYSPINIVWMHHIENGNTNVAASIMKNYLMHSPKIMFRHTTKVACDRRDENIANDLLKLMRDSKASQFTLGEVHSCLVEVFCLQEKYDEALKAVDNALREVSLENIHTTALIRVKDGMEKVGKKFPYKIVDRVKDYETMNRKRNSNKLS